MLTANARDILDEFMAYKAYSTTNPPELAEVEKDVAEFCKIDFVANRMNAEEARRYVLSKTVVRIETVPTDIKVGDRVITPNGNVGIFYGYEGDEAVVEMDYSYLVKYPKTDIRQYA